MTTKEMKLKTIEDIESRLYFDLTEANSKNDEFGNVLRAIYGVADLKIFVKNNDTDIDPEPSVETETPKPEETVETPVEIPKTVDAPVPTADEVPFTVAEDKAEEPTDNGITYDRLDVVKALKQARKMGVNVSDIIRAFGVDNFGDIDAKNYPSIMEQLKKEGAI